MRKKRYANQTNVSVSKSRGEIENILRSWGASQMQWSDDFDNGKVMLRFIWNHGGTNYVARFEISVSTKNEIEDESFHKTTGKFLTSKYDNLMKKRGMVEHRELALFLKAVFVAVGSGIITAEQVFLPFLEDSQGRTVSQLIIPSLSKMLDKGGAKNLLPMIAGG